MSTPTVNLGNPVFRGNRFDFTGSADFSGSTGSVVFYLDPKPSGTPLGPYPLTQEGIAFAQTNLKLGRGKWKIRIVSTPEVGSVVVTESPDVTINEVVGRSVMPLVGGAPTTNPLPLSTNITPDVHALYRTAVNGASFGSKRMAAAAVLVTQMGSAQHLSIYRDNVLVIRAEYVGPMVTSSAGNVVKVNTSTMISCEVLVDADLTTGRWHYLFQGGTNYSNELRGTVGNLASGKNILLSENPQAGGDFNSTFSFVVPAAMDVQ